jgi:trigger factor
LLLSEVGRQNDITIERDDLLNAALESARGFSNPQQVLEFYRSNPNALERFRAPVFEDKVVAFLTELATVTNEVVDAEELFRDPDEEEAIAKEDKAKEKKAAKKKTAAKPAAKKKAASKKSDDDITSDDDESGDEKKAAKKKPAAKAKAKAKSAKSADKPAKSAAKTAKDD